MVRVRGSGAPLALAVAAVLLAATVSCGGDRKPGPATGDTGGGGGGSGSGGSGGGGTTSGGTDGGSGGSTTSGAGGTTGGATGDGGSGGSSGGTSGASGGDGSGGAGGGTSGGSGGGSGGTAGGGSGGASACDGLLPAAVDAGRVLRSGGSCTRADSRPDGQIALGYFSTNGTQSFKLYTSDGSTRQGDILYALGIGPNGDTDAWFHVTGPGYAAIVHDFSQPAQALSSFDAWGNRLGRSTDFAVSSAPDAHGGTVMLAHPGAANPSIPGTPYPTLLEWLDGAGQVLRTVTLDADPTMLLVDWNTDHVLTLIPGGHGGRLGARWYDGAGTPLTPWFDAGPAVDRASLHLLVDGSVAISDLSAWRGVFRDGVAALDPPPAWLAARPATRLATIRGGRGYAVLPFMGNGAGTPDQTRFEVVAASGETCGTVTLPPDPGAPGITVGVPFYLAVGQDGTVFQTAGIGGPGLENTGGAHCEWRWWPALLR